MKHPFDGLTRADLVHRIVILDQQGLSQRAITRTLGISRQHAGKDLAAKLGIDAVADSSSDTALSDD